jgi:predicted RNase H-like HicB family nuclease
MINSPRTFAAYITRDHETGLYIGVVPGVKGAHTQAETLDELEANLREVLELCLEEAAEDDYDIATFVGLQQIELSA